MDKPKIYNNTPVEIKDILITTEGWLVGNSPKNLVEGTIPKDYDIIVPNRDKFQNAMLMLHGFDYGFNTYGGLKFNIDGMTVDKIKQKYIDNKTQKQIHEELEIPFSSVRGVIQRLRKKGEII